MTATASRFIVEGRVQGVFFRDSTRRVAEPLGLSGHAINLPDGTVEVVACGPAHAVDELRRWLATGPRMAEVTRVTETDAELVDTGTFETG